MDDNEATGRTHVEQSITLADGEQSSVSYAGSDSIPDVDDSHLPLSSGEEQISLAHVGRLEDANEADLSQVTLSPPTAENENTLAITAQENIVQSSTDTFARRRSGSSERRIAGRSDAVSLAQNNQVSDSRQRNQSDNSAILSLHTTFESERDPGVRSASVSIPALNSDITALSTVVGSRGSRGSQPSSAMVPNLGLVSSRQTSGERRSVVLPRWQPDAEVTYCPICRTQFSFFVRKHHCRKCGRVVCNSCSPHRITIPYQYIVQPPIAVPTMASSQAGHITDIRESESVLADRNGGRKVRLCNPCVPDPNNIPPQQPPGDVWREVPQPTYYLNSGNRGFAFGEEAMNNLERTSRARGMSAASGLSSDDRREQQIPGLYGGRSGIVLTNNSTAYNPYPNTQIGRYSNQTASHTPRSVPYVAPNMSSSGRGHIRGNQSLTFNPISSAPSPNPQPHYRSLLGIDSQGSQAANVDSRPLPAVPRIAEEDECPICHRELPSRTLPNVEDARAAHITQCIEDQIAIHNGQARPGAYTSQSQPALTSPASSPDVPLSQPAQPPTNSSSAQTAPARASATFQHSPSQTTNLVPAPIANTPEARMAAREAAHAAIVLRATQSSSPSGDTGRRTGMFLYKASEKDCVDDAECTICLEEFEVGVAMARLECLCRFHAQCIRMWFVDHPGRCPVHQHDGYGF